MLYTKHLSRVRLWLVMLVLVSLVCADGAAADGTLPLLADHAGLLTASEAQALSAVLEDASDTASADIVVLTVDSLEGKTAQAYADDWYDENGYGRGDTWDGILFLVAMDEREWAISTTGRAIDIFTEYALDDMEARIIPYLSDGEYGEAFETYAELCAVYFSVGDVQPDSAVYPDGYGSEYDDYYDTYPGEIRYERGGMTGGTVVVCVIAGLLVGLIPVSVMKGQLHSVRRQSGAGQYQKPGSFRLTGERDVYLYRNVSKVPIPRDDDGPGRRGGGGGARVHVGSSGRSHGGRSGGF